MSALNQRLAGISVAAMILAGIGNPSRSFVLASRGSAATLPVGGVLQESSVLRAQDLNKILCRVRTAKTVNVIRAVISQQLDAGVADIPVHTYSAESNLGKHYFNVPVDATRDLIILTFVDRGEYFYFLTDTRLQLKTFARANASGWLPFDNELAVAGFKAQLATWKNAVELPSFPADCR